MPKGNMIPMSLFISYSTKDIEYARAVQRLAINSGNRAYLADNSLTPGQQLDRSIIDSIRGADMLVLVWSKNAHASDWVRDEVGVAIGAGKAVLPIALDSDNPMPAFIRNVKYIDATSSPFVSLPAVQEVISLYAAQFDAWKRTQIEAQVDQDNWDGLKTLAAIGGLVAAAFFIGGKQA